MHCTETSPCRAGDGHIVIDPVQAIAGLMQKLQTHSSVTAGTQHGPTSWPALWAFPPQVETPGGKAASIPILLELPDTAEEEIDVQEACDAGFVDREDLVNEASESGCSVFAS